MYAALGTSTETNWSGVLVLLDFIEFVYVLLLNFCDMFLNEMDEVLDLLWKMFEYDLNKRIIVA